MILVFTPSLGFSQQSLAPCVTHTVLLFTAPQAHPALPYQEPPFRYHSWHAAFLWRRDTPAAHCLYTSCSSLTPRDKPRVWLLSHLKKSIKSTHLCKSCATISHRTTQQLFSTTGIGQCAPGLSSLDISTCWMCSFWWHSSEGKQVLFIFLWVTPESVFHWKVHRSRSGV